MPIHDWTRVSAGTFHDFHASWIPEIRRALNGGLLPEGYYALAEQVAGQVGSDVLTLQDLDATSGPLVPETIDDAADDGGVAVAKARPRVAVCDSISEAMILAARRKRLIIRHTSGDRIVAILEIVSPGNKEKRSAVDQFVDKAVGALDEGYHLMVLDLLPPAADVNGMHAEIWRRMSGKFEPHAGKPLTLAAYATGQQAPLAVTCYVEPTAVGAALIDMPLFYDPGHYVTVPLEQTYLAAYEGVPKRWKRVIEA